MLMLVIIFYTVSDFIKALLYIIQLFVQRRKVEQWKTSISTTSCLVKIKYAKIITP